MLSASNIPVPDYSVNKNPDDEPISSVLLLPAFVIVDCVTPSRTPDLISHLVNRSPCNTSSLLPLNSLSVPPESGLKIRSCPHDYLILLCSHRTRDARCGQSAPLLKKEFERHLRQRDLYRDSLDERPGGVGVHFVSHFGGHKFAANVIVYRRTPLPFHGAKESTDGAASLPLREAKQCIWLARVRPEDCENIVRYTILQGKVVKPDRQLRGGFDRERCVTSW